MVRYSGVRREQRKPLLNIGWSDLGWARIGQDIRTWVEAKWYGSVDEVEFTQAAMANDITVRHVDGKWSLGKNRAGHGERARARGKGGAQEGTHSSQLPTVTIFFATSQEKWMQCSQKLWAERVLQGPAWRKVSPRSTVMVIRAYSYAPLS